MENFFFAYIYLYFIFVLPSLETKQKPNNKFYNWKAKLWKQMFAYICLYCIFLFPSLEMKTTEQQPKRWRKSSCVFSLLRISITYHCTSLYCVIFCKIDLLLYVWRVLGELSFLVKKNIAWHETLRGIRKPFYKESDQNYNFIIFLLKLNCPVSVKQQLLRITFITFFSFVCWICSFGVLLSFFEWVVCGCRDQCKHTSLGTQYIYIDRYKDIKILTGCKLLSALWLKVDVYLPTGVACFLAFDHACGYPFSSFSLQITGMDFILKYLSWVISKYVCCVCSVSDVSKNKI